MDWLGYNKEGVLHLEDGSTIKTPMMNGSPIITNPLDERYRIATRVVSSLQRACVYFSPECEEYMSRMKVFVVDSPTVNAFSSMGSVIVIYTGLIDRYIEQYEGDVTKVENV